MHRASAMSAAQSLHGAAGVGSTPHGAVAPMCKLCTHQSTSRATIILAHRLTRVTMHTVRMHKPNRVCYTHRIEWHQNCTANVVRCHGDCSRLKVRPLRRRAPNLGDLHLPLELVRECDDLGRVLAGLRPIQKYIRAEVFTCIIIELGTETTTHSCHNVPEVVVAGSPRRGLHDGFREPLATVLWARSRHHTTQQFEARQQVEVQMCCIDDHDETGCNGATLDHIGPP
jgi:hypothetical protein